MWLDQRVQTISSGFSLSCRWPSFAFLHVGFILRQPFSKWLALWSTRLEPANLAATVETETLNLLYFHQSLRRKPHWCRLALPGPCVQLMANHCPRRQDTIIDGCSVGQLPGHKGKIIRPWSATAIHISVKATTVREQNETKWNKHRNLLQTEQVVRWVLKNNKYWHMKLNKLLEKSGILSSYM